MRHIYLKILSGVRSAWRRLRLSARAAFENYRLRLAAEAQTRHRIEHNREEYFRRTWFFRGGGY